MSVTSQVPTLKFAEQYVEPILFGRKTSTLRLELDESFNVGTRFQLCTPDGERFASAHVTDRGYNDIEYIVEHGVEGHRDYRDVKDCIQHLQQFYPDARPGKELHHGSCLEIVYWSWEGLWE